MVNYCIETHANVVPVSDVWCVYDPTAARDSVLLHTHASNHFGHRAPEQTHRNMLKFFYLPGISEYVRALLCVCAICNRLKSCRTYALLQQLRQPTEPFETLALDHLGPYCTHIQ
ncbi:hypothetical protein PR048_023360 [Dryococelus australis]|uniref:Integrase zinc-binding domain-containing protein n=1 Tax=Dryococelus australis TaxID=614101 RepID=A0ABQ9GTV7_9NEOP|nr:hypothetical protein PR048_023360 [Dryococelus australis]